VSSPVIPLETIHLILQYADVTSLCQSSATCKDWKKLSGDDEIWENLLRKQFSISASSFSSPGRSTLSAKEIYVASHQRLKELLRNSNGSFESRFHVPIRSVIRGNVFRLLV
jgi:hypothetical protein